MGCMLVHTDVIEPAPFSFNFQMEWRGYDWLKTYELFPNESHGSSLLQPSYIINQLDNRKLLTHGIIDA